MHFHYNRKSILSHSTNLVLWLHLNVSGSTSEQYLCLIERIFLCCNAMIMSCFCSNHEGHFWKMHTKSVHTVVYGYFAEYDSVCRHRSLYEGSLLHVTCLYLIEGEWCNALCGWLHGGTWCQCEGLADEKKWRAVAHWEDIWYVLSHWACHNH